MQEDRDQISDISKTCPACRSEISKDAWICKECGTRQNSKTRVLIRLTGISVAVATVLSIVATGIALGPTAYSQIVRDPKPRLIEMTFDTSEIMTRTIGTLALFNGGNVDAYVTRLEFKAKNEIYDGIGPMLVGVYEQLKQGQGIESSIAFQAVARRTHGIPAPTLVLPETFTAIKQAIIDQELPIDRCFVLFPFDARLSLPAPKESKSRHANVATTLSGKLYYLDPGSPTKEYHSDIEDLYMEAAVFLEAPCIRKLGGKDAVEALSHVALERSSDD
jgi:hypothetical protein